MMRYLLGTILGAEILKLSPLHSLRYPLCVCVCVCVHIYILLPFSTDKYTYTYIHIYTYICTFVSREW